VIIMQETRSFDHYFGTFPGADGIPMANGVPTVCITDPATGVCVKPFHDETLVACAEEVAAIFKAMDDERDRPAGRRRTPGPHPTESP
jgi:phospholipase C